MEIQFNESQRFNQWWIYALLIPLLVIAVWAVYQQIILGIPFGDKPVSNTMLIFTTLAPFGFSVLLIRIFKLETEINEEGFTYRFFPFHLSKKEIKWADVEKVYTREYRPLWEYGGWGIKGLLSSSGRAYNVSGNKGLQFELKNGKKVLFGTLQMEELNTVLAELRKKKIIA